MVIWFWVDLGSLSSLTNESFGTLPRLGGDICSISTLMPLSVVKAQPMRLTFSRFHTCWAPSDFSQVATHNEGSRSLDPFKDWAKLYAANFQQQYDAVQGDPGYISLAFFGQVAFIFIGDGQERLCLWVEFLDLGDKRDLICVTVTVTQQTQHFACLQCSCRVTSDGLRLFEVGLEDPGCTIGQRPECRWVGSLHWYHLNLANPLTDHAAKKCSISRDSQWTLKRWSNFLKESVAQISSGPRLVGTISRSAVDSGGFS